MGCWLIFVEVKDKKHTFSPAHMRDSVWCYSKNQKNAYKTFLADYNIQKEEVNLPLAELKEPYQNMALVYYDKSDIKDEKITDCVEKINPSLQVYITSLAGEHGAAGTRLH